MSFTDMVVGESGLLVELRCHNTFNEKVYTDITNYLSKRLAEWKLTGFIPVSDAVSIFSLMDEMSGGSRFWSEDFLSINYLENIAAHQMVFYYIALPAHARQQKRRRHWSLSFFIVAAGVICCDKSKEKSQNCTAIRFWDLFLCQRGNLHAHKNYSAVFFFEQRETIQIFPGNCFLDVKSRFFCYNRPVRRQHG